MARRLPEIFEDMRQALLGNRQNHSWRASATEAYGATVNEIKDLGGNTLTTTAEKFNAALPYIERAGYTVTEIEVGLGLSPKLVAHLRLETLISEAEQEDLLLETKGKTLTNTLLASLFRASAARSKLKFRRFHFTDLELELSILPTITLRFKPNEESAGTDLAPVTPP